MLDNVQLENYKVVGKGSVYPVKSGKQTLGLAFYYSKKNEKDKKRKVVLGNSEEELENKALTFLKKMDMETMEERGVEKQEGSYINIEERQAEIQKDIHFREAAAEWLAEYAKRRHATKKQISYSSVESRACSLKKINQYIGDVPVKDIDNDMAEKLIDQCSVKEDGTYYSESHVDKLQQAFLLVMEYARNKGYCEQVVKKVELAEQLTKPKRENRFIDMDVLNEIFRACQDNPKYYTLLKLLISTGLRQEEAFALHVDDFQIKENSVVEITINKTIVEEEGHQFHLVQKTKTKRSTRVVVVSMRVYELVMNYYNHCIDNETEEQKQMRKINGTEGFIFLNPSMKFIHKRTFQRSLKKYLAKRGISDKTLHMFRHSYASLQADNVDFQKVARMLGDNPQIVYDMYYSLSQKSKEDISQNVNTILNQFKF